MHRFWDISANRSQRPKLTFLTFKMAFRVTAHHLYFRTVLMAIQTDIQTDRRSDGGRFNISRLGHSARDKKDRPPPPRNWNVGNSIKWTETFCFQYFKQHPNNIKNYTAHPHDMVHIPPINIKKYTAHPQDMVHIPAKFRENTVMRVWVTVRKLNVTDRRTDWGRFNISHPGPLERREIKITFRANQLNPPFYRSSILSRGSTMSTYKTIYLVILQKFNFGKSPYEPGELKMIFRVIQSNPSFGSPFAPSLGSFMPK